MISDLGSPPQSPSRSSPSLKPIGALDRYARLTLWLVGCVLMATIVALTFREPLTNLRPPVGLVGQYYSSNDWTGTPLVQRTDREISSEVLANTPELGRLTSFSIEWSGYLVTHHDAVHRFATKSDDGSWIWIDDRFPGRIFRGRAAGPESDGGVLRISRQPRDSSSLLGDA